MSHVLQWTQFEALIWSLSAPGLAGSGTISYTLAGQKCWQGLPNSSRHRVAHTLVSATTRWTGSSSAWCVPDKKKAARLSYVSTPSGLGAAGFPVGGGSAGFRRRPGPGTLPGGAPQGARPRG